MRENRQATVLVSVTSCPLEAMNLSTVRPAYLGYWIDDLRSPRFMQKFSAIATVQKLYLF
ncbi:uncharacterized protein BDV17DRAFT_278423 [Aspergillus undulatus]|uniref:uncharacterized protein n=1 Tax=Aspergillus undulatus TaxID=1810928 RepID=UPI003CCD629F